MPSALRSDENQLAWHMYCSVCDAIRKAYYHFNGSASPVCAPPTVNLATRSSQLSDSAWSTCRSLRSQDRRIIIGAHDLRWLHPPGFCDASTRISRELYPGITHSRNTYRAASQVMVHSQATILSGRSDAAANFCQRLACCYHRCVWPLLAGWLSYTTALAVPRTTTYPGGLLVAYERLGYSHAGSRSHSFTLWKDMLETSYDTLEVQRWQGHAFNGCLVQRRCCIHFHIFTYMLCCHRDGFEDGQPPSKDTGAYDGAE